MKFIINYDLTRCIILILTRLLLAHQRAIGHRLYADFGSQVLLYTAAQTTNRSLVIVKLYPKSILIMIPFHTTQV